MKHKDLIEYRAKKHRKLYIAEIDDCQICPACHIDANITRYECSKKGYQFIAWMNAKDKVPIPEWCPLPDSGIIEDDFRIE